MLADSWSPLHRRTMFSSDFAGVGWMLHGLVTTVLSGAGFVILTAAIQYAKNYNRKPEEKDKMESNSVLVEQRASDQPFMPFPTVIDGLHLGMCHGQSTSLFERYKLSGHFLGCGASQVGENRQTTPMWSPEQPRHLHDSEPLSPRNSCKRVPGGRSRKDGWLRGSAVSEMSNRRWASETRYTLSNSHESCQGAEQRKSSSLKLWSQLPTDGGPGAHEASLLIERAKGAGEALHLKENDLDNDDVRARVLKEYNFILPYLRGNVRRNGSLQNRNPSPPREKKRSSPKISLSSISKAKASLADNASPKGRNDPIATDCLTSPHQERKRQVQGVSGDSNTCTLDTELADQNIKNQAILDSLRLRRSDSRSEICGIQHHTSPKPDKVLASCSRLTVSSSVESLKKTLVCNSKSSCIVNNGSKRKEVGDSLGKRTISLESNSRKPNPSCVRNKSVKNKVDGSDISKGVGVSKRKIDVSLKSSVRPEPGILRKENADHSLSNTLPSELLGESKSSKSVHISAFQHQDAKSEMFTVTNADWEVSKRAQLTSILQSNISVQSKSHAVTPEAYDRNSPDDAINQVVHEYTNISEVFSNSMVSTDDEAISVSERKESRITNIVKIYTSDESETSFFSETNCSEISDAAVVTEYCTPFVSETSGSVVPQKTKNIEKGLHVVEKLPGPSLPDYPNRYDKSLFEQVTVLNKRKNPFMALMDSKVSATEPVNPDLTKSPLCVEAIPVKALDTASKTPPVGPMSMNLDKFCPEFRNLLVGSKKPHCKRNSIKKSPGDIECSPIRAKSTEPKRSKIRGEDSKKSRASQLNKSLTKSPRARSVDRQTNHTGGKEVKPDEHSTKPPRIPLTTRKLIWNDKKSKNVPLPATTHHGKKDDSHKERDISSPSPLHRTKQSASPVNRTRRDEKQRLRSRGRSTSPKVNGNAHKMKTDSSPRNKPQPQTRVSIGKTQPKVPGSSSPASKQKKQISPKSPVSLQICSPTLKSPVSLPQFSPTLKSPVSLPKCSPTLQKDIHLRAADVKSNKNERKPFNTSPIVILSKTHPKSETNKCRKGGQVPKDSKKIGSRNSIYNKPVSPNDKFSARVTTEEKLLKSSHKGVTDKKAADVVKNENECTPFHAGPIIDRSRTSPPGVTNSIGSVGKCISKDNDETNVCCTSSTQPLPLDGQTSCREKEEKSPCSPLKGKEKSRNYSHQANKACNKKIHTNTQISPNLIPKVGSTNLKKQKSKGQNKKSHSPTTRSPKTAKPLERNKRRRNKDGKKMLKALSDGVKAVMLTSLNGNENIVSEKHQNPRENEQLVDKQQTESIPLKANDNDTSPIQLGQKTSDELTTQEPEKKQVVLRKSALDSVLQSFANGAPPKETGDNIGEDISSCAPLFGFQNKQVSRCKTASTTGRLAETNSLNKGAECISYGAHVQPADCSEFGGGVKFSSKAVSFVPGVDSASKNTKDDRTNSLTSPRFGNRVGAAIDATSGFCTGASINTSLGCIVEEPTSTTCNKHVKAPISDNADCRAEAPSSIASDTIFSKSLGTPTLITSGNSLKGPTSSTLCHYGDSHTNTTSNNIAVSLVDSIEGNNTVTQAQATLDHRVDALTSWTSNSASCCRVNAPTGTTFGSRRDPPTGIPFGSHATFQIQSFQTVASDAKKDLCSNFNFQGKQFNTYRS